MAQTKQTDMKKKKVVCYDYCMFVNSSKCKGNCSIFNENDYKKWLKQNKLI